MIQTAAAAAIGPAARTFVIDCLVERPVVRFPEDVKFLTTSPRFDAVGHDR